MVYVEFLSTGSKTHLSKRQQFVNYNGHLSSYRQVKYGKPQSRLFTFLDSVNDICNVLTSSSLHIILFAKDMSIFLSCKDLNSLSLILNKELSKLTEWFSANKLSVNIKKYIVFRPRQIRQSINIKVNLCNQELVSIEETIFLGVISDQHLTWTSHISNVAR